MEFLAYPPSLSRSIAACFFAILTASAAHATVALSPQIVSVNFGSINVCASGQPYTTSCSRTLTLTFNVVQSGTLGTTKVLTRGAPDLDYSLGQGSTCAGTVTAGSTCTVVVTLRPRFPGLRAGSVEPTDTNGKILATTFVEGKGLGDLQALEPLLRSNLPDHGVREPLDVGVDGADNLYVPDHIKNGILILPASGGTPRQISTGSSAPILIALNGAGDLYAADADNNRVFRVPADGSPQTTVGSDIDTPEGLAVDGAGNLFIADSGHNRIVKVPADGSAQTYLGSGLQSPIALAVTSDGDLLIDDSSNDRIVKITRNGIQSTVASNIYAPTPTLAVDAAGNIFYSEGDTVTELFPDGEQKTLLVYIYPENGLSGMSLDSAGDLFVANADTDRIVEVPRTPTASVIDFSGGFARNSSLIQINGTGSIRGNALQLTKGLQFDLSSGFATTPVSIQGFTTEFTFHIVHALADGMTFTLQNVGPGALGGDGGSLGYATLQRSVAIKFDTFNNSGEGDNSTGLYVNGATPTLPAVDLTGSGIDLHSEHFLKAQIVYDGAHLTLTLTDLTTLATFSYSWPINIPAIIGSPNAYVGFTGSGGTLSSSQKITSWTFTAENSAP